MRAPNRWLIALLVVITGLVPGLLLTVLQKGSVPSTGHQAYPDEATDSYYSMRDRRCYALTYTDTLHFSHTLALPLTVPHLSQSYDTSRAIPNTEAIPSKQAVSRTLDLGKQFLVAEDESGSRVGLYVHYWSPADRPNTEITRTLTLSLSALSAVATYVVESPVDSAPKEVQALWADEIEAVFFVKRLFYANQPDARLAHCRHPVSQTLHTAFAGSELSTVAQPEFSVNDGVVRTAVQTTSTGWRFEPQVTIGRLLNVSPSCGTTVVAVHYDQGSLHALSPLPTSCDKHETMWKNPRARIRVEYDPQTPPLMGVGLQMLVQSRIDRLRRFLHTLRIDDCHLLFSLLFTLWIPLLPSVWLWRLRKCELAGTWPQIAVALRLTSLVWVSALAALVVVTALNSSLAERNVSLLATVWSSGLTAIAIAAPASMPGIIGRIRNVAGKDGVIVKASPYLLIVGSIVLAILTSRVLSRLWHSALVLPLTGLLLALVSRSLVKTLTDAVPRVVWWAWAGMLIALTIPLTETMHPFDPLANAPVEMADSLVLMWGICILPYLGLVAGLVALERLGRCYSPPPLGACRTLLAFLVALTGPLPQLWQKLDRLTLPYVLSPVSLIIAALLSRAVLRQPRIPAMPAGKPPNAPLAFGPRQNDWDNGCLALWYGTVLGVLLTIFYGILLLPNVVGQLNTPLVALILLPGFALPFLLRWLLGGFFLGYLFVRLPGRSGTMKGLSLACIFAVSVLTYDVLFRARSLADLLTFVVVDVVLNVLGLMGIGAFLDYATIKQKGQTWQQLLHLYRIPYLAGYLSTLVATLSSTVAGALTGRINAWVANLVEIALRALGSIP